MTRKKDPLLCSIPDCPRPKRTKGLCDTHYSRVRRNKKGIELEGPIRRPDDRADATVGFARVLVRPDTRAYFEELAAAHGQRVISYLGTMLDAMAAGGDVVKRRKAG